MNSMKYAAALAAVASLLLLAACGGGGGSPTGSAGPREAPDLASTAAFNAAATRDAAAAAANAVPQYGSVFQAASGSAATAAAFDGSRVGLSVAGILDLNSEDHSEGGASFAAPPVAGHTGRRWGLAGTTADSLSAATVFVSWAGANPSDWLAFGYWLHATGDPQAGTVAAGAAGAFVDGPEFADRTAGMPTVGFGRYQGIAAGIYAWDSAGDVEVEEASGLVKLSADFRPGKARVWGLILGLADDVRLDLETASYTANGRIGPASVSVVLDQGNTVLKNAGKWGGRFSNRDDDGKPRAIGGTVGADWTDGGNRGAFIGAFFAPKD